VFYRAAAGTLSGGPAAAGVITDVKIDDVSVGYTVDNAGQMSVEVPNRGASAASLTVEVSGSNWVDGSVVLSGADGVNFVELATSEGDIAGETVVTFSGSGFSGLSVSDVSATFDGVAATDVTIVDDNTITVKTPPHVVGAVDVMLNLDGESLTWDDGFEYIVAVYLTLGVSSGSVMYSVSPNGSNSGYTVANVDTNNPTGYELTLESGGSDLVCGSYTIPSIAADGTLSIAAGKHGAWGWNVVEPSGSWTLGVPDEPSAWRTIPFGASAIMANPLTPSAVGGDDYGVFFGATVDWGQPACSGYQQTLTITVVGN
jgi:hypothetical protein